MRSSIETPDYEVLRVLTRKAEIRRYPSLILAQTQMTAAPYSQNSSTGFRRVAGYIFGGNEQGQKIAMTSPVIMEMGTETEVALKNTLEKAKKENVDAAIATEYQQLLSALQKSEENMLNQNQKEIKNLILDEIIKRYQYKEGLYLYYTKNNSEIKK